MKLRMMLVVVALMLFAGCSRSPRTFVRWEVPDEKQAGYEKFFTECALGLTKSAGIKTEHISGADQDLEDWVVECRRTADAIYDEPIVYVGVPYQFSGGFQSVMRCSDATHPEIVAACKKVGAKTKGPK